MAERRYSFRFSLPEGCVILLSLLLTSFLVFLFGVYVGKEVEAHKAARQTRTARLPASASGESSPARPIIDTPAAVSTTPAEKPEAPATLPSPSAVSPTLHNPSSSSNAAVVLGQKPSPSLSSSSEASVAVVPKPRPDSPSTSAAASVAPKPPSSSSTAAIAPVPKPRPDSPSTPAVSASVAPKPSLPPAPAATAVISPKPKPSSLASSATLASPVKAVGSEFDSREKKPLAPSNRWAVQVQATTQEVAAQNVAKQLREQGLFPVVSKVERQGEVWYRVRVGKFANEGEAEAVVSRFRREGKFTQAYPVLE